jgi:hypothetical protein
MQYEEGWRLLGKSNIRNIVLRKKLPDEQKLMPRPAGS